MSIKIGICGTGAFADCFIPLFRAHPLVRQVVLCDLDAAKLAGIPIPTLCHDGRLHPYGACRICLVAVDGPVRRLAENDEVAVRIVHR